MAKKDKERSEVEYLKGLVRKQKSIIKELQKEIGRASKKSHLYDDIEEKIKDLEIEEEIKSSVPQFDCPQCKKGNLDYSDLGVRLLITCSNCKYRESKKK